MALYRKGAGQGLLFIGGSLAHNANCCCDNDNTYVGCYCPSSIPSCISGLTQAQIQALNYFPQVMVESLNKDCTDLSEPTTGTTYRCLGYSNPSLDSNCSFDFDPPVNCATPGSIIYTGPQVANQASLNCNQYINFGTGNLGVCKGYEIPSGNYLGQFCAITQTECSSYVNEYTSVVWTVGTCLQINTVSIETLTPDPNDTPPTYQEVCEERNCCDSDDCNNPKFCACSAWRIVEVGANGSGQGYAAKYQESTTLCNIPESFLPPTSYAYIGYMQLQFNCDGAGWVAKESWTVQNGCCSHTFQIYDTNCVDCANLVGVEIEYGGKL